ncbi:archaeosortase H [Promethearchaeum syntrophicum]|uniref:Archaeosortase H n=1 Tax=Promethearchaeum syntrophicum TaxID=2594042 RepID=A0A5B9DCK5_9ARCH|nr:archaeosortase H [Candidatus Prometheoarchaeum syntrophicum]QEE16490.1 Transmembrane exosortase (Exosortase_EpsH) [Candidatus Prometheoarchaeum syntrophicum]
MGNIEYEGKNYDFKWLSIAILFIGAPIIAYGIWISHNWVWLHEISAKITIWILNLLSGAENVVYFNDYDLTQPWIIHLPGTRSDIHFETLCTGVHAIAIFVGAILCVPHSINKETSKDIWKRKIIAMLVTSLVFYVVNIFRMVLQLYLYQRGADWDSVHYPISAASSFIAVACVLIMHKYVPEFIMSLIWIGDELKAMIKERSDYKKVAETMNSENSQDEEEQKIEKTQEDSTYKTDYD